MNVAKLLVAVLSCSLSLPFLATGKQKGVRVYQVPKAPSAKAIALPKWQVPKNWRATPPQALQQIAWQLEETNGQALVTVVALGKNTGKMADNLGRWAKQIQANVQKAETSPFMFIDGPGQFFLLEGDKESIFVGLLALGQKTWFFKLKGDKDVARQHLAAFKDFLRSVRFTVSKP